MALNNANMLTKITELQPRKYQFFTNEELKQQRLPQLNAKEGKHFGLLAQELEEIFPELVTDVVHVLEEDVEPEQRAGKEPETVTTKAINYQELTVVLLAAIQEMQSRIETLETAVQGR